MSRPTESAPLWCALTFALAACPDGDDSTTGPQTSVAEATATTVGDSGTDPSESSGPGPVTTTTTADSTGDSTGDETGGPLGPAEPSRYPLELVSPRAAGTAPSDDPGTPAMPSGHRIFRAYPGLPYEVRAVVLGGSYPYRFALSDAPAGMTIDADTGVIAWPEPTDGTVMPTITVVDGEGTEVASPWAITVDSAGFRFVDAVAGDDGDAGTHDSPWRTLAAIRDNPTAGEIVYFRAGTYSTGGMPVSGSDTWVRVEFGGEVHSVQWLAYPEETPVIDNGHADGTANSRFIRISGSDTSPVYLDGFEITNAWDKGLQFGSGTDYPVFRRLDVHGVAEAIDGSNSAGIMTLTSVADPTWYGAYQDIDFHDNAPGGIKQYSHRKVLWEDVAFRSSGGGPDLKADVPRFEVRRCTFTENSDGYCGLFGNMHVSEGTPDVASGEVRYNLMLCGDSPGTWAMDVNQDGQAAEVHLYRNTFVGTVRVRNTDGADGPFDFTRNVIVNSGRGTDHVTFEAVDDATRVTFSENLSGAPADGIVDAAGNLQGEWLDYLGTRGHQIP